MPQEKVLRIADRRECRTRVDRQRLEYHQPRHRQAGDLPQTDGERHDHEQRHVVGQYGGQRRRSRYQAECQYTLAADHFDEAPAEQLQHAAGLNRLGQDEQAGQCGNGVPVNQRRIFNNALGLHKGQRAANGQQRPEENVLFEVEPERRVLRHGFRHLVAWRIAVHMKEKGNVGANARKSTGRGLRGRL